ncbi:Gfo/Idh/MocA family protein [Ferrovibrio sp.]|uniref:Gfo/Idh/MocA family protein n=1 Tax=Ferrovibrio sp. TaxID=1917215 RepID=UPI0035186472
MGDNMKVRFAICGLGFAGSVLMAPAMKAHPDVEIIAACDPNAETREKFGADFQIPTFASLNELLASVKPDAVYIASPHQYHCEHVLLAAEHGVNIIVEKPLTLSLSDADRMIAAVKDRGVHLVVGHSRSHDPVIKTMRHIIDSGDVGRLAMINCWNYTDFLYRPRRPEELDTYKGGGIVFNQLPHQIDSIKAISGQTITSVHAIAGILDPKRPTQGHCTALLKLSNGVSASLVYSGYDHFDSDELQFWVAEGGRKKTPNHGNSRRVLSELPAGGEAAMRVQRYGYGGPISKGFAAGEIGRQQPHFGIMVATCEQGDLRPSPTGVLIYGNEGIREVDAMVGRGSFGQGDTIDELVDAMAGRKPVMRDAAWGRNTVAVCLAILESSKTGQPVEV